MNILDEEDLKALYKIQMKIIANDIADNQYCIELPSIIPPGEGVSFNFGIKVTKIYPDKSIYI